MPVEERGEFSFNLDVPFSPRWHHVELLRTSILNCLATIFESYDFCQSLSMTAAELLENAIAYGSWSDSTPSAFRLRVVGDDDSVQIEIANPVEPSGDDVRRLMDTLQQIRTAGSPREAYVKRLEELLEASGSERESQLGLLRIVFETGCSIEAKISENGEQVRVCACIGAGRRWGNES